MPKYRQITISFLIPEEEFEFYRENSLSSNDLEVAELLVGSQTAFQAPKISSIEPYDGDEDDWIAASTSAKTAAIGKEDFENDQP